MKLRPTIYGCLTAGACAVFATGPMAQGDPAAMFLADAIRSNLAEVRMGELAQERGKDGDIRDFGETLVEDHTMGAEKTSALAKTLGVTPPTEPDAEAKRTYDMLSKLSGEEFDREFAKHMAMAHQKAIAKYTEQAAKSNEPEVASLAKETLPRLREHLEAAEALARETKKH